jgi:hypothetical protein
MEKIFIVDGVHEYWWDTMMSAHATIESANKKAAELVNLLLEDIEQPQDAKPETWEADLLRVRKAFGIRVRSR